MGCDIHPFIEVYNETSDKWHVLCGYERVYGDSDNFNKENGVLWDARNTNWSEYRNSSQGELGNRNYDVFAVLADVRNRGSAIIPICDPKGKPEDVNEFVGSELSLFEADYHSTSWHTFDDLLDWWEENKIQHKQYCEEFFETIEEIRNDLSGVPASHIRLVFAFDN